MACFHPIDAWRHENGSVVFWEKRGVTSEKIMLPCGQCVGCRLERSRQWAIRCMHEAQLHERNAFVTLTYDDAHLPEHGQLVYEDFQKFARALRRAGKVLRYYGCGEYGSINMRPHFHACLFGLGFDDGVLFKSKGGHKIYTSAELSSFWPHGYSSFGEVTFESAAYVARYIMKKVTGDAADAHYRRVDVKTGEVFWLEPEFNFMSLKPGIGAEWFKKYTSDVLPRDYCVVRGRKMKVPKYYQKLMKLTDGTAMAEVEAERFARSVEYEKENPNPPSLASREAVAYAQIENLKRDLE